MCTVLLCVPYSLCYFGAYLYYLKVHHENNPKNKLKETLIRCEWTCKITIENEMFFFSMRKSAERKCTDSFALSEMGEEASIANDFLTILLELLIYW